MKRRWRWFWAVAAVVSVVWIYWFATLYERNFMGLLQGDLEWLAFEEPEQVMVYRVRNYLESEDELVRSRGSLAYLETGNQVVALPGAIVSEEVARVRKALFLHDAYRAEMPKLCTFNGEYLVRFSRQDIVLDFWICYGCGELMIYRFSGEKVAEVLESDFSVYGSLSDEREVAWNYFRATDKAFQFGKLWDRFLEAKR